MPFTLTACHETALKIRGEQPQLSSFLKFTDQKTATLTLPLSREFVTNLDSAYQVPTESFAPSSDPRALQSAQNAFTSRMLVLPASRWQYIVLAGSVLLLPQAAVGTSSPDSVLVPLHFPAVLLEGLGCTFSMTCSVSRVFSYSVCSFDVVCSRAQHSRHEPRINCRLA